MKKTISRILLTVNAAGALFSLFSIYYVIWEGAITEQHEKWLWTTALTMFLTIYWFMYRDLTDKK